MSVNHYYSTPNSTYQYTPTPTVPVTQTTPPCSNEPTSYDNTVETPQATTYTATSPGTMNASTNTATGTINAPVTTTNVPTRTSNTRTRGSVSSTSPVSTFAPTTTTTSFITETPDIFTTSEVSNLDAYFKNSFGAGKLPDNSLGCSFSFDFGSKELTYSSPTGFFGTIVCDIKEFVDIYESLPVKFDGKTLTYRGALSNGLPYTITVGKFSMPGGNPNPMSSTPTSKDKYLGFNAKITF